MHSPSALTEHVSLCLAGTFLLRTRAVVVGAIQVTWIGGSMAHVIHIQFGIVLLALILVLVIVFVQVYPN